MVNRTITIETLPGDDRSRLAVKDEGELLAIISGPMSRFAAGCLIVGIRNDPMISPSRAIRKYARVLY